MARKAQINERNGQLIYSNQSINSFGDLLKAGGSKFCNTQPYHCPYTMVCVRNRDCYWQYLTVNLTCPFPHAKTLKIC
jgi:hypothetical protein